MSGILFFIFASCHPLRAIPSFATGMHVYVLMIWIVLTFSSICINCNFPTLYSDSSFYLKEKNNLTPVSKVDMPILTCIFFTFNWLTLTFEMHFVKFHPEVASCLLSRGKRKYAPLGLRLIWKYIRNYFLVGLYQLISHSLLYLENYKEFKAKILDLQPENYGLSFDIKKCTTSGWALGDENVIGIRAFNRIYGVPVKMFYFQFWTKLK